MSPLKQIHLDFAGMLESNDLFEVIPVYAIRAAPGVSVEDLRSKVDQALGPKGVKAGKAGVCVSVLMPLLDVQKQDAPGPVTRGSIVARVQENPTVNSGSRGTKLEAEAVALEISQLGHHLELIGVLNSPFVAAKDHITPDASWPGLVTYDVKFEFMLALQRKGWVLTPSIAPDSGSADQLVTLSCGTRDALIYYTTDESFPGPNNPLAVLYREPFAPECEILRAAAYLKNSGLRGSSPNMGRYRVEYMPAGPEGSIPLGPEGSVPVGEEGTMPGA